MHTAIVPLNLLLVAAFLSGCSTTPQAIRQAPAQDIRLAQVVSAPDQYAGSPVRWGGTIVSLRNDDAHAWLEVLEFDLNYYGEPCRARESEGRFIARIDRPQDAEVYRPGRDITVAGTVSATPEAQIGGGQSRYPAVAVTEERLWEPYSAYRSRPYYWPFYSIGIGYGSGGHYRGHFGYHHGGHYYRRRGRHGHHW